MRILLIGPYPPPYGGLAVQIEQLRQLLTHVYRHECQVLNIGESRRASVDGVISVSGYFDFIRKLRRFAKRGYILHLVTNGHGLKSWISAMACGLAGILNKKRTVLVFGSGFAPQYLHNANLLSRKIIRFTVVLAGKIICRNEAMRVALIAKGAQPHKVIILPGFLGIQSSNSLSGCSSALQAFIEKHAPILGVTVSVTESGRLCPEYGLELAVSAVKELRLIYPTIGMLIIGANPSAKSQIQELEGIESHIMFAGPLPHDTVLTLMRRLTIFLRPTYTDGDSNSVREAMELGVPVIASNTDFRPEGVTTFFKGNINDLVTKLRYTIDHLDETKANARKVQGTDTTAKLLELYDELLHNHACNCPHVETALLK